MGAPRKRWLALSAHLAVAVALALVVSGLTLTGTRAQDDAAMEPAVPACGEVLGIGSATDVCLRVLNLTSPDLGAIDVYVGGAIAMEAIEYGQATEFAVIPSGATLIQVVPAGTPVEPPVDEAVVEEAPVDDTTVVDDTAVEEAPADQAVESEPVLTPLNFDDELQPGAAYQLTVTGLPGESLNGWMAGFDLTDPPAGQARVRLVHAAADVGSINVASADGTVPFEGIEFGDQSGDVLMPAGVMNFQALLTDDGTVLVDTTEVTIEEGNNYDLVVYGRNDAGTLEMAVVPTPISGMAATPVAGDATPVAGDATPVVSDATPVADEATPTS